MSMNDASATDRVLTAVMDAPPVQKTGQYSGRRAPPAVRRGVNGPDLFDDQAAGQSFDLMADCQRAHLRDLGWRRELRIDVDLRAGEAAQRALRRRVHDAALLHHLEHQ